MKGGKRPALIMVLLAGSLLSPAMATARTNEAPVMIGALYERALNFVGGLEQVGVTAGIPFTLHWQPFSAFQAIYVLQAAGGRF